MRDVSGWNNKEVLPLIEGLSALESEEAPTKAGWPGWPCALLSYRARGGFVCSDGENSSPQCFTGALLGQTGTACAKRLCTSKLDCLHLLETNGFPPSLQPVLSGQRRGRAPLLTACWGR